MFDDVVEMGHDRFLAPVVSGAEFAVGFNPKDIRVEQRREQLSLGGPVGEVTVRIPENLFLTGHHDHLPSDLLSLSPRRPKSNS